MKPYEVLVILPASLDEEGQTNALDKLRAEVARLGGEIVGSTALGKRAFARPMKKQESGYYMRLEMNLDAAQVTPLQARLKLMDDVFRVQILRSVPRKAPVLEESPAEAKAQPEEESGHGES